ncbi:MAG: glycosyltransferase [Methanomicrobiaceae archaeon]|nr:glycosyltransferase [Methanomicrobiaceae archaeon]
MDIIPEKNCTLVVPAYNEERRIESFLSEIKTYTGPVIFVCDGIDKTASIARAFAEKNKDISLKILVFKKRLGKGGGILEGIKASETDYVGFIDADGSTSVLEMNRLFSYLSDYDCAIGSRWLKGAEIKKKQKAIRLFQSRLFNFSVRLLFGLKYHDTQCGAKVFRKEPLKMILPEITSKGFEFDVEVLYLLLKKGFSITEVPIKWNDMDESHVGSGDGIGMLVNLVKIRFGSNKKGA